MGQRPLCGHVTEQFWPCRPAPPVAPAILRGVQRHAPPPGSCTARIRPVPGERSPRRHCQPTRAARLSNSTRLLRIQHQPVWIGSRFSAGGGSASLIRHQNSSPPSRATTPPSPTRSRRRVSSRQSPHRRRRGAVMTILNLSRSSASTATGSSEGRTDRRGGVRPVDAVRKAGQRIVLGKEAIGFLAR